MTVPLGDGFDTDGLVARIEEQVAQAQENARRAEQVRDQFEQVRGRAASPHGEVRVTVETTGRMTALELADDALRLDARDLAALILETVATAQRQAATESIALVEGTFGAESGVAANLRSELARMAPPEDPRAQRDEIRWS
ncbi:YbaB/EbfC family nucleoid-associated protein [Cellulomonas shaoxiangyii]|uniref:YbaB/EbfC family DNA-binding protein n=1 Tax=Cellulomonas shaoxiangyii TaxID=2566013 RepID=A0A4P7SMY2_9CELL|nr:YbaB/EbfC family nucleoid-associated protein [Cellulomonas shaoxiangyii]QCB94234.1 YbaB/EbfC family DNA-binding protein [Cellulomonas shaoxiangyii]TGY86727.1 YbaB/EbfC family DNA-binding protein [Cellulomonas shaoxiangyii]